MDKQTRARYYQARYRIKNGIKTIDDYDQTTWKLLAKSDLRGKTSYYTHEQLIHKNRIKARKAYAERQIEAGETTREDYDDEWLVKNPKKKGPKKRLTIDQKNYKEKLSMRKYHAKKKIEAGEKTREDYDDEWFSIKKPRLIVLNDYSHLPPPPVEWILDMHDDAKLIDSL